MGADVISLNIRKQATKSEISKAIDNQAESDKEENGHRDGYSGDFQLVDDFEIHDQKIFLNHNEAWEYCDTKAEKYGPAIAVYYYSKPKDKKPISSSKLTSLENQIKNIKERGAKLKNKIEEGLKGAKSKTIGLE